MPIEFVSAVVLLALVTDPFGNVPLVNAMLAGVPSPRRRLVIARECTIAFLLLMAFMLFVFPGEGGPLGAPAAGEPFIVPLAIPFIAGPSALATVMLLATREPSKLGMWALAITVTMAFVTIVLMAGEHLQRWLGDRVMQAIERLMGLILTAMAVEMLLGGIRAFVAGLR